MVSRKRVFLQGDSVLMTSYQRYLLHLADSPLILGHRLGEWCGHGPVLEQDIALTNIALDLIGQSRHLFQYVAATLDPPGHEDALAMLRYESEYLNHLLVEQPNVDFAHTVARQFFYDTFQLLQFEKLTEHPDTTLRAIAVKSVKEIKYHYRYSSEWMLRLGDGTTTSHEKIQTAVNVLWRYTDELFMPATYEAELASEQRAVQVTALQSEWNHRISDVFQSAGIVRPSAKDSLFGGKEGRHTEHIGYILTELQYMQRTYPQMNW